MVRVRGHEKIVNGKKIKVGSYIRSYDYNNRKYKIYKSPRKNKQRMSVSPSGNVVHYGDPDMPEYPDTKREDSFCARSFGIKNGEGEFTRNNPDSANFWNRRDTWECRGKKGV